MKASHEYNSGIQLFSIYTVFSDLHFAHISKVMHSQSVPKSHYTIFYESGQVLHNLLLALR